MATGTDSLLAFIDEAFAGRAWHGPTLRGALRGVTVDQASWRPGRRRHNIWEVALHAAYWKHAVRRRITRGTRGTFPARGSNWFDVRGRDWAADLALLTEEHEKLRATIAALPPRALERRVRGRDTIAFTIRGIAAHDLYHAGQIQLLKRLQKAR